MIFTVKTIDENKKVVNISLTDDEKKRFHEVRRNHPDLSRIICVDENGKEYFSVPNIRTVSHNPTLLFSGHIKDAIDEIRYGIGDAITSSSLFQGMFKCTRTSTIRVCHYLDREYGESLKKKSIEGWKDAKFCYAIQLYNRMSMSSGYLLTTDYDFFVPITSEDENKEVWQFDSYEEAVKIADSLEKESKEMVKLIESVDENITSDEFNQLMDQFHTVVRYSSEDGLKCFHNPEKIPEDKNPWIIRIIQDVKL